MDDYSANQEVRALRECVDELTRRMDKLQNENELLKRNWDRLEEEKRKKHLIFFGISEEGREQCGDTYEKIIGVCWEKLGMDLSDGQIIDTFRIGNKTNRNLEVGRPILVKFKSEIVKERVVRNRRLLANSTIRIDNDWDLETRSRRRLLIPFLKAARKNGHFAVLIKDRIKINHMIWSVEQCLEDIKDIEEEPEVKKRGLRRLQEKVHDIIMKGNNKGSGIESSVERDNIRNITCAELSKTSSTSVTSKSAVRMEQNVATREKLRRPISKECDKSKSASREELRNTTPANVSPDMNEVLHEVEHEISNLTSQIGRSSADAASESHQLEERRGETITSWKELMTKRTRTKNVSEINKVVSGTAADRVSQHKQNYQLLGAVPRRVEELKKQKGNKKRIAEKVNREESVLKNSYDLRGWCSVDMANTRKK